MNDAIVKSSRYEDAFQTYTDVNYHIADTCISLMDSIGLMEVLVRG